MDILQLILLSFIQGLTEFLPVSSSAHLVLLSEFLGEEDQGIIFDVGVHFGTLMAALVYFRSDLQRMVVNLGSHNIFSQENSLTINLVIAVIPILLIGFFLRDFVDLNLRNSRVIAYATIIFGILLYVAQFKETEGGLETLNIKKALIIGIFQCVALIPGTSRSGITITAGLLLGLRATEASRFSFLLAIPTIGAIALAELIRVSSIDFTQSGIELFIALIISFLIAYISIDMFLRLIERIGFTPFVIYRLLLGIGLLMFWT
tara:strand:+ start:1997 stop:2782 length:786 start_codon:yes stop_codon:yes gene_type:complete